MRKPEPDSKCFGKSLENELFSKCTKIIPKRCKTFTVDSDISTQISYICGEMLRAKA